VRLLLLLLLLLVRARVKRRLVGILLMLPALMVWQLLRATRRVRLIPVMQTQHQQQLLVQPGRQRHLRAAAHSSLGLLVLVQPHPQQQQRRQQQ
jgi:hypothetical protein